MVQLEQLPHVVQIVVHIVQQVVVQVVIVVIVQDVIQVKQIMNVVELKKFK